MLDHVVISGVVKRFSYQGQLLQVLRELDMVIREGEFVCVLGPSGCGKTVLLHLVAGFIRPDEGEIKIKGQRVFGPSRDRAVVFQDYVLFPWKSVAENIAFGLKADRALSRAEVDRRVSEILRLIGLQEFREWPIHRLSGGMQQRIAIARSLVVGPTLLLMDEPFAALDTISRHALRRWLGELWAGSRHTTLFVTHSVREAVLLADRIYLLTRRPATISQEYVVDLPRPRNLYSTAFTDLLERIERDMERNWHDTTLGVFDGASHLTEL